MGEASKARRRKLMFLEEHPFCCFCGGGVTATTWDHVPSKQMFSFRRRPKGLEVPACAGCNRATSQHEQVAAFLGRIYPDGTDAESEEAASIMKAVNRSVPGLLHEMQPSSRQVKIGRKIMQYNQGFAGVLNCNGPILNESIQKFGAKFGLAVHYYKTKRIVPKTGGVAVRWFTNYDAISQNIPPQIFHLVGGEETLRQGQWSTVEQFTYAYGVYAEQKTSIVFGGFRKSFAVVCWVMEDAQDFLGPPEMVHRPGQL